MLLNNNINLHRAQERYIGEERKGKDAAYISALAFGNAKLWSLRNSCSVLTLCLCCAAYHPR